MVDDNQIVASIYSLIADITENSYNLALEPEKQKEALYFVISDSIRATHFVILIEDEFDIEFEDDELDIEFFSDVNRIVQLVKAHLMAS